MKITLKNSQLIEIVNAVNSLRQLQVDGKLPNLPGLIQLKISRNLKKISEQAEFVLEARKTLVDEYTVYIDDNGVKTPQPFYTKGTNGQDQLVEGVIVLTNADEFKKKEIDLLNGTVELDLIQITDDDISALSLPFTIIDALLPLIS